MLDSIVLKGAIILGLVTVNTPIEVLKMRMNTNVELRQLGRIPQLYKSFRHCGKTIFANEGLYGFWKGNVVMVSRLLPVEAINFYVRKYLQSKVSNTFINNVFIAMSAGISATAIVYPSQILRIFMSNQVSGKMSVGTAFKDIKKDYGMAYFYKGMPTLLTTVALYRAIYNGLYDNYRWKAKSIEVKALIAYFCTILAQGVAYPIEIVRRRRVLVNSHQSFFEYAQKIGQKEGLKGFYRGASVVPLQSVMWSVALLIFDTTGVQFESSVLL